MAEYKNDAEAGLALQIYMMYLRGERNMPPYSLEDRDMIEDPQGPWYRREDGTYGDYWMEVHNRHVRNHQRETTPRTAVWDPTANRPELHITNQVVVEEIPPVPQAARYRVVTPTTELNMRACKREAKEILEALYKD